MKSITLSCWRHRRLQVTCVTRPDQLGACEVFISAAVIIRASYASNWTRTPTRGHLTSRRMEHEYGPSVVAAQASCCSWRGWMQSTPRLAPCWFSHRHPSSSSGSGGGCWQQSSSPFHLSEPPAATAGPAAAADYVVRLYAVRSTRERLVDVLASQHAVTVEKVLQQLRAMRMYDWKLACNDQQTEWDTALLLFF